ncbi:MAG: SDR family NAD(P)-dependent oxidoreductase [Myxococcota bacterium]
MADAHGRERLGASSSLTHPPIGGLYQYRSTKAALNAITVGLALDLAAEDFRVVALHPGLVQTRMGGPDAPYTPGAVGGDDLADDRGSALGSFRTSTARCSTGGHATRRT